MALKCLKFKLKIDKQNNMNRNFRLLFSINGNLPLILSLVVVGCFSVFSYLRFASNLYVDIDGFCYLNTVGSVWTYVSSGLQYWIDPLRSPLLILFIPPEINIARFAMITYLLISTFFIFLIVRKLTKRVDVAFVASVSFGTIPYLLDFIRQVMSDLPAIALFLAGLYVFLHGLETQKSRTRNYLISSTIMGFSFLIRFDMAILILPIFILLLLKDRRSFVTYLIPFLFVAVFLQLISTYLYVGQLEYLPWKFVYTNFFTSQWAISHVSDASFYYYLPLAFSFQPFLFCFSLLSLPIVFKMKDTRAILIAAMFIFFIFAFFIAPKTSPRVFVINYFAIATLLASILLTALSKLTLFQKKIFVKKYPLLLAIMMGVLLISSFAFQTQSPYLNWTPQETIQQIVDEGTFTNKTILSNCFQGLIYFISSTDSSSKPLPPMTKINQVDCILTSQHDVESLRNELEKKNYDLLVYFEYPELSNFDLAELEYLKLTYSFEIMLCGDYNLFLFHLDGH